MTDLPDGLEASLGEPVTSAQAVGGGSINSALRVTLGSGSVVFVKHRAGAAGAEFAAERAGLEWLRDGGGRVPAVVASASGWLALEWVEPGRLSSGGEAELGTMLAGLHLAGAERHGELPPSSPDRAGVGSLQLPPVTSEDWGEVYVRSRVLPAALAASERGRLDDRDLAAVERVCGRIGELIGPAEPPARLHGDLWSGNVMGDREGRPWLIDPTAYAGHREVDLAMLRLFGGPSRRTYDAYDERHPLAPGHEDRVELWQLSPLLVHAALFGGSYGPAAGRVARRYAG